MSTKEQQERIKLLQGAQDLLILRALLLGPAHGHAIARAIEVNSEDPDKRRSQLALEASK